MRKTKFAKGQYYHVYNRGVDKRKIFLAKADYERFIKQMLSFNNIKPLGHLSECRFEKVQLVDIIAYCLMPNHFHLLLRPRIMDGISKYLHRVQTGYTMYFNKRNDRSGVLMQGAYKCKLVLSNANLLQLSKYIHTNPIKLFRSRDTNIADYITNYPWSSLHEYLDPLKADIIDDYDPILGQFKNRAYYKRFIFDDFEAEPRG